MGKRQPLGQLPCGLVGSRPVKRHHGGRDPRGAQQLGAPAVADGHDLNKVRLAADSPFEAMNGHDAIFTRSGERRRSYASGAADQAKRDAKALSTRLGSRSFEASSRKKILYDSFSTAFARVMHIFSTVRGR